MSVFNIIGFIWLNAAVSYGKEPLVLITDDEAKNLKFADSEWEKENIRNDHRALTSGPSIIIEEPDVVHTDKGPTIIAIDPADIYVLFKGNNSALDLSSLDVWAEKYFFKINVTSRVRPYIKIDKEGAQLHAESVHIPKGKYKIGFKISDINGQEARGKYLLKVE